MKSAPNLALVGPMGAGKSSVAAILAGRTGLERVDVDAEVERVAGTSVTAIFGHSGEAAFRELEAAALQRLLQGSGLLVATGGGAVLDPTSRALLAERAFVVHLHATPAEQMARLAGDTSRPLLQGHDPAARLEQLARERDPLYAAVADLRVDTAGSTPGQVASRIHAALEGRWRGVAA